MNETSGFSRRQVLGVGAAAAAGLTVGITTTAAVDRVLAERSSEQTLNQTVDFHGKHQPGIATPLQTHGWFVALDLLPELDTGAVGRLLRLWTSDIALLMAGRPAMADSNPELAAVPARLTVTVGLGRKAFEVAGKPYEYPVAVAEIPSYEIDALEPQWVGGDLLLQICADEGLTVAHAARELIKDALPFATVKWIQRGHATSGISGMPHRNMMGMIEGSDNPKPEQAAFDFTVFNTGGRHPWFQHGSTLAFRRIRMNLDTWEKLKPADQEQAFGRRRGNGAPLTGKVEADLPDFLAKQDGKFVIAEDAHIRRASLPINIFRRVYNYDDAGDTGLLFVAYGAEISQYLEIQSSLAKLDSLNRWTTPVGSAVFAILPGVQPGEWLGQSVFGEA